MKKIKEMKKNEDENEHATFEFDQVYSTLDDLVKTTTRLITRTGTRGTKTRTRGTETRGTGTRETGTRGTGTRGTRTRGTGTRGTETRTGSRH